MRPFNGYDIDNYSVEKSPVTFLLFHIGPEIGRDSLKWFPECVENSRCCGFSRRGFRASELAVMIWSLCW